MNHSQAMQHIAHSRKHGAASVVDRGVVPTRDELLAACADAQAGSARAREQVINMTSILAFKRAQDHYLAWHTKLPPSASFDDVFHAAIEGVLYALGRFEPERGNAFTTVAELWIRQRVQRSIKSAISSWGVSKEIIASGLAPGHQLHDKNTMSLSWTDGDGEPLAGLIDCGDQSIAWVDSMMHTESINERLASIDERLPAMIRMRIEGHCVRAVGYEHGVTGTRVRQLFDAAAAELADEYASWFDEPRSAVVV